MWHDWLIEKRVGDIYNYSMLGGTKNEFLLYINDEFCGYLYDKDYVKRVCAMLEDLDDDKVIRLVTKKIPMKEWKK